MKGRPSWTVVMRQATPNTRRRIMRWTFGLAAILSMLTASASYAADVVPVPATALPGEMVMYPAPVGIPALTLKDACCCDALKCLPPGQHRVTFIHPYTCCPVDVCFCLPCGCYKVECGKGLCAEKLRFDVKGMFNDVVIKFTKDGGVKVND